MEYALVIKQERWWGLVSMHLYQVKEDDTLYRIIDEVDNVPESQELGGLCSRTQLMDIYKRQGTRAFRSYTDFYERGIRLFRILSGRQMTGRYVPQSEPQQIQAAISSEI